MIMATVLLTQVKSTAGTTGHPRVETESIINPLEIIRLQTHASKYFWKRRIFFSVCQTNTRPHEEYSNRFRPSTRNAKTMESNIISPGIPTHKANESKRMRYGRIGPRQQLPDNHEPRHRTLNYRDIHEGEQGKCGVILERTIGQERIWSIAAGRRGKRQLLARVPRPKLYWNWLN